MNHIQSAYKCQTLCSQRNNKNNVLLTQAIRGTIHSPIFK